MGQLTFFRFTNFSFCLITMFLTIKMILAPNMFPLVRFRHFTSYFNRMLFAFIPCRIAFLRFRQFSPMFSTKSFALISTNSTFHRTSIVIRSFFCGFQERDVSPISCRASPYVHYYHSFSDGFQANVYHHHRHP